MSTRFDVLGVGNAIMDVIAPVQPKFLSDNTIARGAMTLIDEQRAIDLHSQMSKVSNPREIAGGSAANTLVGLAEMGVRGAYIGKVANDDVGARFVADMKKVGVDFNTTPLMNKDATARSLIAVTPDGERSMSTFLGASVKFGPQDIVRSRITAAKIIYLEGYLFDSEQAKTAFITAGKMAQSAGRKVALTLSDTFCVDRHRQSFKDLVKNHVDILFANEAELLSLYEHKRFDDAIAALRRDCQIACVTRSEKGSVIIEADKVHPIAAVPVDKVVDTTGAGDQYAAGVLAGHVFGLSWRDAGHLGSLCAAEVITHYGARPTQAVNDFMQTAKIA